jgi:hypothetical protein
MSIITGRALPRRTVLRGLGTTLALPLLDSMVPALVPGARAAVQPVHRFQTFYMPNGMAMPYWEVKEEGSNFQLSPILEPLAPFRDQMLVLSGLYATWVVAHAGASGSFLTGIVRGGRNETETLADVSVDQLLAKELGKQTQNAGACTANLSCVYTHTISWRGPRQPLPMEYNPRAVFERLFGDSGSTARAAREARMRQRKSILDAVTERLADIRRAIGRQDQAKIDEYAESVRDVERRIQMAEAQSELELPVVDQPQGAPPVFEDHLALMLDLQILAFRTDLTRVVTFMLSKEQSARPYPQIGVPEAHHPLSHHNDDPVKVEKMSRINRHHTGLFAKYLAKLRETPDGDGSLLDHMTILFGCGISNSTSHSGVNLPVLLVGGGAGRLKGGRHIRYTDRPWMANLLVTLMDKFDLPVEKIGRSTGRLPIDTLAGV